MKRKLLSAFLALTMVLPLLPFSALAEGTTPATGPTGTVVELTKELKQVTATETVGSGQVPVTTVTVAPTAPIAFSPMDDTVGRNQDGWWVGISIQAPKEAVVDGTSSNAVRFRNNNNYTDRYWVEAIDGGTGKESDPYYMTAWGGPSVVQLASGKTDYTLTWYFNWDGDATTGVTVPADNFKSSSATGTPAPMNGVDQVIRLKFELTDSVRLLGENGELAWPIKVTFDTGAGASTVPAQNVGLNGKAKLPDPAPTRGGYTFDGWYKESGCTNAWTFDTDTVTKDVTLYAKWKEDVVPSPSGYRVRISSSRHGDVYGSGWREAGEQVTLRVEPDSSYRLSWIEAEQDDNGRQLELTRSGSTYTFTMPAADVTVDAGFVFQEVYAEEDIAPAAPAVFIPTFQLTGQYYQRPAVTFPDIPWESWAYQPARWAYQNGYLDLAANGKFYVNGAVSHLQMWSIMAQWMGQSFRSEQEIVNWAHRNGAAAGDAPNAWMARDRLIVYLYKCYFLMGGDTSSTASLAAFADSRLIVGNVNRNAWTWAVGQGIISGTTEGRLEPDRLVTRGEFALILMRLCQR